jgi:hypothetical protein
MENTMNKTLLSLAIALAVAAGSAHAERAGHRQSFAVDRTRTTERGVFTSHTDQTVTQNGFTRDTSRTNPNGKTATRDMTVTNDAQTKTHTREVSGTTMSGKNYSSESVLQKTDSGYTRESTRTNPNGKTTSRDVDATIDKDNHSITKDISVTGPNGQVHETTVVKQYSKGASVSAE